MTGDGASSVGSISASVSQIPSTGAVSVVRGVRRKYGCQPSPAGIGASLSLCSASSTVRPVGESAKRWVAR